MFSWWGSSDETETKSSKEGEDTGNANEGDIVLESPEDNSGPKDATETAKDLAKNFGSFLYSVANVASQTAVKVKDTVKETVEGKALLGDFSKEQEKFLNEKHSKRKETGVPPWVGYNEEETMKSQILALSSDERNFLRDPPAGVQFHYDYDSMFPVALATLEEDPELKEMRFNLVPKKVKEITFWRNYFYRVSLIKQSSQLTSLASSTGNISGLSSESQTGNRKSSSDTLNGLSQSEQQENVKKPDTTNDDIGNEPTHEPEFISDDFDGSHELSKEDLEQIGVERLTEKNEKKQTTNSMPSMAASNQSNSSNSANPGTQKQASGGIPDWERELQEELEDYDVVNEVAGNDDDDDDDGSWEKEIEDMLEAE